MCPVKIKLYEYAQYICKSKPLHREMISKVHKSLVK